MCQGIICHRTCMRAKVDVKEVKVTEFLFNKDATGEVEQWSVQNERPKEGMSDSCDEVLKDCGKLPNQLLSGSGLTRGLDSVSFKAE